MNRLFDCFLYNDEEELLSIRLHVMAPVVYRFIVVHSRHTLTGGIKPEGFPHRVVASLGLTERVEVVELDELGGRTPVEREAFSRNAIARALQQADAGDLVMLSDVDEIVRPATAAGLAQSLGHDRRIALGLDYYNFKFNYLLVHGEMAIWSGPVVCRMGRYRCAQDLRDWRWRALDDEESYVEDAGWHFSFLTPNNDLRAKLDNYSHRETDIQARGDSSVKSLIANRQGFFDHRHAGSVWAVVALSSFGCQQLEKQVAQYRELLVDEPPDEASVVNRRVRHSMRRIWTHEREKVLWRYTWRELASELGEQGASQGVTRDALRDPMPTAQHYTWQVALYLIVALAYGCAIVFVVRARTPLRKWLGASFLVTYLENVVTFPAALLGDERYLWLLGHPDTTLYFSIVLVSVVTTMAGFFAFTHLGAQSRLFGAIPPLRASTSSLRWASMCFSTVCAVVSIVMSATGYFGYFTTTAYLYSPPVWLDTARTVIGIGGGTIFVLFVAAGAARRRVTVPEWGVAALWSLAGLTAGFKSLVMLPFFYILLATWLTGRCRLRQLAVFGASIMVAYAVVEPLRGLRLSVSEDSALEGLNTLVSEDLLTVPEVSNVLPLFLSRIDYTTTGVSALEADRLGQLEVYRSRLAEAYRNVLVLAFVPRAVWPDKPLFDYGRELNIALTGMDTNAITPSGAVASYLWLGYPGVLINAILLSYVFVCSGRLLTTSLRDPLAYLPVLLLVILIWTPESIVMARYVGILRASVAVGIFYLIAGHVGLLRKGGRALPWHRYPPLRQTPDSMRPDAHVSDLYTGR